MTVLRCWCALAGVRWQREMSSAASSRAALHHGRTTGNRPASKGRKVELSRGTAALKAKEEEYMRVNAELEAKTSALVQEAEELVKGNLSILSDLSSSTEQAEQENRENNVAASAVKSTHSPPGSLKTSGTRAQKRPRETEQSRPSTSSSFSQTGHQSNPTLPARPKSTQPVNSRAVGHHHSVTGAPPTHDRHSSGDKPLKSSRTVGESQSHSRSEGSKAKTAGSHLHHAETVKPPSKSLASDVDETVRRLEMQLELEQSSPGYMSRTVGISADVVPEAAEGMGSEALIRFLKAKLRVLQEELEEVCHENTDKDKKLSANHAQIKQLAEENGRLQRSYQTLQSQMSKYRDSTDTLKHKCEGLEAQLVAMRKEIENMKATQKKAASSQGALEVRLNRALEEAEKYKTELLKARAESKDLGKQERQRADQLVTENKQLERQRNELMVAFKKQMKLIDILKRQKMHIEAAKLLSFTEEEFVRALDWGTT